MSTRPKLVSIEGNIGSGKSTVLQKLAEELKDHPEYVFLQEPVDQWDTIRDYDGKSILAKYYEDNTKYGFSFQVMAFTTRLSAIKRKIKENPNCSAIICERSLEADRHIFAKMLHNEDKIDDINYQVYMGMYNEFAAEFSVDSIVYMNASPETCHARISQRARSGEETIPLEYLDSCHKYHEIWLSGANNVYTIDANPCVSYKNDIGNKWLQSICEFVSRSLHS
jgi:deoxyadenosine/deoxycytidine kinase